MNSNPSERSRSCTYISLSKRLGTKPRVRRESTNNVVKRSADLVRLKRARTIIVTEVAFLPNSDPQ